MMNTMTALASVQGQDGIMALIKLMEHWEEVKKALTDFEAFRAEYNAKVKEVNEEVVRANDARKLLDEEIKRFMDEKLEDTSRLFSLRTSLEAKTIQINASVANLETWELALQREKEEVEAKSKRADANMVDAVELSAKAKKMMADAEDMKKEYHEKLDKFRSIAG